MGPEGGEISETLPGEHRQRPKPVRHGAAELGWIRLDNPAARAPDCVECDPQPEPGGPAMARGRVNEEAGNPPSGEGTSGGAEGAIAPASVDKGEFFGTPELAPSDRFVVVVHEDPVGAPFPDERAMVATVALRASRGVRVMVPLGPVVVHAPAPARDPPESAEQRFEILPGRSRQLRGPEPGGIGRSADPSGNGRSGHASLARGQGGRRGWR
jgi:hypothetical protein